MYHIKDDKRSKLSAELIYTAYSKLLKTKNFDDIKITEVVALAEVGRATFYRNFDHLEDVLHYKCDQRFQELRNYLLKYYENNPMPEYSFFITPFLKFWYSDSLIIEQLMSAKRIKFIFDAFSRLLEQALEEIPDKDEIFDEHVDYFIAMRSGIAITTLIQWIRNKKDLGPEEISSIVIAQMGSEVSQNLFKHYKDITSQQ